MTATFEEDTLVYDCESATVEGLPNPHKDIFRIFACYSYKTDKTLFLTRKEDIQRMIDTHKYLVGFNNNGSIDVEGYDNILLKRLGIKFDYKIMIDLRAIIKQRASQMKIEAGMLGDIIMSYSLKEISEILGIVDKETGKMELDYNLLKKETWTPEEIKLIRDYTQRDIDVTRKMYEWLEEYFWPFRSFLNEEDIRKKVYLTATFAKLVYKIICKQMQWKEEYGEKDADESEERIKGGYVSYPAGERFDGNIYVFDYASLYPHAMMQANLHSRRKSNVDDNRPVWNGGGKWQVQGEYYSDQMGNVAKLFQKWYKDRLEYKKNKDRREYTLKIALNASYGMTDDPYYRLIYDKIAAGDCTGLGRQFVKYARKRFREEGFKVIYTDTDSIYLQDVNNNRDKLMETKKKIIEEIKQTMPFPQDTFDLALEAEAKYMFFFKGGNEKEDDEDIEPDDFINKSLGFMKKNYIYVQNDGKLVIKNLGLRKKSNSGLSKEIFWNRLVPKIKEGTIKFSRKYILDLINELLQKDINYAVMRKEVGQIEQYVKSEGSLPAQIARQYGSGIHFLVPNTKNIGIGKGKKYCTVSEFKAKGCTYKDIDIEGVLNELDYFILPPVTRDIFSFSSNNEKAPKEEASSAIPNTNPLSGFLRGG
jgi:DNA polymerase elongation subunit (family B)